MSRMSPEFWESVFLSGGIVIGAMFAIGLMLAVFHKPERRGRSGGMVE